MTSMADLRDIATYAAENESAFRPLGDDGQLAAPEGGGGLSLMTRSQEHVQLAEPKRFAAEWEADASLRVRAGDQPSWTSTSSTAGYAAAARSTR